MELERRSRENRRTVVESDAETSGAAPFKKLRAAVGIRHGKTHVTNNIKDQEAVMSMFDQLSVDFGGNRQKDGTLEIPWWPLANQGKCDIHLWMMILRVQNTLYEKKFLGFKPDGVIDPGGRTEYLIQFFTGKNPPFPASDTKEIAIAAIPLASRWVKGASDYLVNYRRWRSSRMALPLDPTAANVHLHLDRLNETQWLSRVNEWQENYRMIAETLRDADKVFVRATRDEALAARNEMKCWGVSVPAWARARQNIWFGPDMINLGPNCKAAIIIHEAGHYIKAKIGHQGGERGKDYDTQSADQALMSAYVCANFATHATTGRDERFGLARPNV